MAAELDSRPLPSAALFRDNRSAVLRRMLASGATGAILMFGLPDPGRIGTDYEPRFRQESYFWYLTGVNVPGCATYIDISTGHSVLFYPDIPDSEAIWSGEHPSLEETRLTYGFDDIHLVQDVPTYVASKAPARLYTVFKSLIVGDFYVDSELLLEQIGEQRQIKSEGELWLMRYSAHVNELAYRRVLRTLRPGLYEFQVEAEMQYEYFGHNCLYPPFQITICSGEQCAILHYHKKTRKIADGDLVLIDAGGEYEMYCADNTRTYPANGKFSADQRLIYTAVLETQKAVIASAKPGVSWIDLALLSAAVMAEYLVKAALLVGDPQELVDKGVVAAFYPHGLGHGMGLDVHEVAGWPKGTSRPSHPNLKYLRIGRVLEPGMVLTVEPGCYFVPRLYSEVLGDPERAKYINADVCVRMQKTVGGVRIEDDILITSEGCQNLSAAIPKEIDEIEALMKK
jgi:Xaa-Pro dipeptidase